MTKVKNLIADKIQKLKLGPNSKTQIVTTQNSTWYNTQKHKIWQNSRTKIVIKLKNSNNVEVEDFFWTNIKLKL